MLKKKLHAADLFCGAGGTSTGLVQAAHEVGYDEVKLVAVNHWDVAIATHTANHPGAKHLCETLDNVNPRTAVPSGYLDILVASPECIHHSNARGGTPMNDQSRASAWHICRWAEALYIKTILVENVPEFESWGPLGSNGRPLESKKGALFQNFLDALRSLGYTVDYKLLNAANYGDATSRTRLFVMAKRGRCKIEWPTPTHTADGATTLFGPTQKWRAAREIIDWSLEGHTRVSRC
jgi:DNA (cytosine-5)-methyltransferase 1